MTKESTSSTNPFRRFAARAARRASRARRGTILLVALGVLGILSVAAVSYVTIVQLDRRSAIVASRPENFRQQVNAVVEHVRALLAADLVGNKIVTAGTPVEAWPGAFEDGETWDYPSTIVDPDSSRFTYNENDPDEFPSSNARLDDLNLTGIPTPARRTFEVGFPDDAWLASIDPLLPLNGTNGRAEVDETRVEYWPQITNLRSAYTWDAQEENWVRGDGRFVDLAQWFLAYPDNVGFAQPGIDLRNWRHLGFGADPGAGELGPEVGVDQEVANVQMHHLGEDDPVLKSIGTAFKHNSIDALNWKFDQGDERHWVDTDGDGRPDSRWTTLESLGNLFGLNWVVAARIIDANGLINLNSAIEFAASDASPGLNAFGTGQTPADVDLRRLLREANLFGFPQSVQPIYAGDVFVDRLNNSFQTHLVDGVPMQIILNDAGRLEVANTSDNLGYTQFNPPDVYDFAAQYQARTTTSRIERYAHYHLFGSDNRNPLSIAASALPERDLIDLLSAWGTNNSSLITPTEQRFDADGPDLGYLPDGTDSLEYGPFRARELPEDIRQFDTNENQRTPNNRQLFENNLRRLVTPVNGLGSISPVPVSNDASIQTPGGQTVGAFAGISRREKVSLDDALTDEETQRAFEAFVWALAPLATDHPLFRPTNASLPAPFTHYSVLNSRYHYGGGTSGGPASVGAKPGLQVMSDLQIPGNTSPAFNPLLPDYALFTAASMSINLRDALDDDNFPSVAQFKFTPVPFPGAIKVPGAVELDTRFAHGDINASGLPSRLIPESNPAEGVLFVGLDRQPFISEVTTIAVYSDAPDVAGTGETGDASGTIGDSLADHIGSAFLVELSNPWSTPIFTANHVVELTAGTSALGAAGHLRLQLPDGVIIGKGQSTVFYFESEDDIGNIWDLDIFPEVQGAFSLSDNTRATLLSGGDSGAGPVSAAVKFDELSKAGSNNSVVLATIDPKNPAKLLVIDRISPQPGESFPADPIVVIGTTNVDNVGGAMDDAYFGPAGLGYDVAGPRDPRLDTPGGKVGRAMVTSSLSRGKISRGNAPAGSFPAYVFENPSQNVLTVRREAHAWLETFDPGVNPSDAIVVGTISRNRPRDLIDPGAAVFPPNFPDANVDFHKDPGSRFGDGPWTGNMPSFQLFTPARQSIAKRVRQFANDSLRFSSLAELHMLCTYSHFYQGTDTTKLDTLTTVGEWLGQSLFYDFTKVNPMIGADPLNPYIGVLDPTRFLLTSLGGAGFTDLGQVPGMPDHMAIPLALRVFDCFDILPRTSEDAALQGLVSVNTAPNRVLQMLPFVDLNYSPGLFPNGTIMAELGASQRLLLMEQYRGSERFDPLSPTQLPPELVANIPGLRGPPMSDENQQTGFVSIGELAILDKWENPSAGQPRFVTNPSFGFCRLGFDTSAIIGNPSDPADTQPFELVTDYGRPEYNPGNDAEERLALFRALSNIVTTRSDVFICWFVLRGYDPETIEQVNIGQNAQVEQALFEMEDPTTNFKHAYESRWLAVLDRSNVKRPTDRPLIRMLIELPPVAFSPQIEN